MTPNIDPLNVLTPDEHQQVKDVTDYLREHAKSGFQHLPERSVAKVLNNAPPRIREYMQANKRFVDDLEAGGGRYKPFQERITPELDAPTQAVFDKVRTEEITHGLNERLGTQPVEQPTTLRDIVDAAYESQS